MRWLWIALLLASCSKDEPPEAAAPAVTPGHQRMLDALQEVIRETTRKNTYLGDSEVKQLREVAARLAPDVRPETRFLLHFKLGEGELRLGNERAAIEALLRAYALLEKVQRVDAVESALPLLGQTLPAQPRVQLVFRLGLAYLRLGETENCCRRFTPDSCILPIRGDGIHTKTEGSRNAARYFLEVLQYAPRDSAIHYATRWLLNLAYMTLGEYPDRVPPSYRLPPRAFESAEDFPRFPNIAQEVGLATFGLSGGAIADDFDNDGYLDLVVSAWNPRGQIRFWRNNADGTFSDRTKQAGLDGLYGGLNLVQADYDNDGHTDILVLRGAWLATGGRHPNSLLRNLGDGTFTDVTFRAGLADVSYPTQTAAWADYDHDGDLDLYIGNETGSGQSSPCQLFRNDGDGTFTDIAKAAGVTNDRITKGVVWGDFDGDRRPDLYVSNYKSQNRLYRNNGDDTFTDVAPELGVTGPLYSFPAWFWDFDNDGHLDLYVSAYAAEIWHLGMAYAGAPGLQVEMAALYRGDGKGGFRDVARSCGLTRPNAPMGSNFGDADGDGWLDFYLGTGYPDYKDLMPNVLYRNVNGKRFADVTTAAGLGMLQKGHAVVFADFDHDGDQDIFEQTGGAFPGDAFADAFYENPGFDNRWITVRLVGKKSNRSAIGARLRVVVNGRSIYKHVNSGGSFGGNPLRQTIGLGKAREIERLEVFWPTTGETQTFTDVETNRFYRIVEGENRSTPVAHKQLRFR